VAYSSVREHRELEPGEMSFAQSDALFRSADMGAALGKEYEEPCQLLCYARIHPGMQYWAAFAN